MKKIIVLTIFSAVLNTILYGQNIFTVTKVTDPDPFDHPYNYNDALCDTAMYGTLQWAIRKANDAPDSSVIVFNIPGSGPYAIYLNNYLPALMKPITIDGTTQLGYNYYNGPSIIIDGSNLLLGGTNQPWGFYCFNTNAYSEKYVIKGLLIRNFYLSNGIVIWGPDAKIKDNMFHNAGGFDPAYSPYRYLALYVAAPHCIIQGNILGTDLTGTQNYGCTGGAVHLQSQYKPADSCLVGGSGINEGNLIAYNGWGGVTVINGKHNRISRNRIYNTGGINLVLYGGPQWWGNEAKPAPVIDTLTPTGILSGTSEAGDIIEIFGSTGSQNANEYLITTTADGFGNWSAVMNNFNWAYFIATATDTANNTSEFSNAFEITFLPIPLLSISFTSTDATCNGAEDGTATVVASGSIPPYSYNWSNGQTTDSITGLVAGDYTVTVSDSIGSTVNGTIIINEPPLDTVYTSPACSELFMSEYVEGSTHNTALEIYNPTDTVIVLNRYFLRVFMNGAPTPLIQQLVGVIYPGGTFVIANPNADISILVAANQTANKINFNGDDPIQFVKVLNDININIDSIEGHGGNPHAIFDTLDLDTIDQIGIPGVDPGNQGYSVDNGSGTTKNSTLRRNFGVTSGTSDWTCGQMQWKVFGQNDASDLGNHQNKCSKGYHEIKFEFANPDTTIDGFGNNFFEFDILVSANDDTTYLHNTAFHLKYDTVAFGSYIAINHNIFLTRGTAFDIPTYQDPAVYGLTNDYAPNIVRIFMSYDASQTSWNLVNITPNPIVFYHVKMEIKNCNQYSGIEYDSQNPDNKSFLTYDYTNPYASAFYYDATIFTNDLNLLLCDSNILWISGFTPKVYAGTYYEGTTTDEWLFTIDGIGFGATRGNGNVWFRNANTPNNPNTLVKYTPLNGTDFISWTDSKIQIKMPSVIDTIIVANEPKRLPGSGQFYIKTNSGDSLMSSTPVEIGYGIINSILNNKKTRWNLANTFNDTLMIGFYLSTTITNHPDTMVELAIRKAINDWICYTEVNFRIVGETMINVADSDGVSVITFVNSFPNNPAALAKTTSRPGWCYNLNSDTVLFPKEIDIAILSDPTTIGTGAWYYDTIGDLPQAKHDFFEVVLHETGHATLLKHVNNYYDLMYYATKYDNTAVIIFGNRRWIAANDFDGGMDAMDLSINTILLPSCGIAVTGTQSEYTCAPSSIKKEEQKEPVNDFSVFPNPFRNELYIKYSVMQKTSVRFSLLNHLGAEIMNTGERKLERGEYTERLDINNLKAGFYILIIKSDKNIFSYKLVNIK